MIHECSGNPVVVAFDSGKLKYVAQAIFEKYHATQIIICADNDCYHENGVNSGVEKAEEAANLSEALVIVPKFKDVSTHPTDFNDLFILEGKEAVQTQLNKALQQPKTNGMSTSDTLDNFILR